MLALLLVDRKDIRMDGVEDEPALPLGLQDAAPPQDLQMVRDVGDVFLEILRELADAFLPAPQGLHNPQPVLVPERFEPLRAELGSKSSCLGKLLHADSIAEAKLSRRVNAACPAWRRGLSWRSAH